MSIHSSNGRTSRTSRTSRLYLLVTLVAVAACAAPWRGFRNVSLARDGSDSVKIEYRVPQFDHGGVEASYVVTIPYPYDSERTWPLIVDFHGAISPKRRGAHLTRASVWGKCAEKIPAIVVGLNSRTRAWGMVRGDRDDRAYALHVLGEVMRRFPVDAKRVYLAGFSSGSDFLCSGGLQLTGKFAASLVVCPGPPSVVGLRGGELLRAKDRPFIFATGEQDIIRKDGAWQAFLALEKAGGRAMYREVSGKGHSFLGVDEYARLFELLERSTRCQAVEDRFERAREEVKRDDFLLASTELADLGNAEARALLAEIEKRGRDLVALANAIDIEKEPGRAYEAWWRIRTQFHRFDKISSRAQNELDRIARSVPRRDLYRSRRDVFRRRPKGEEAIRRGL